MKCTLCAFVIAGTMLGCSTAPRGDGDKPRKEVNLGSAFGQTERRMTGSPASLQVQGLDVYQMKLPMGAVSRSEEFWKRVDEHHVDVATYDLLLKNGVRVGVAPAGEWDYFKAIIEQHPVTTKRNNTVAGGGAASIELMMKQGIEFQNIFYLNDAGDLPGRTYERCDNLLNVTFQAAPRKPGNVRITVCPVVRSARRHIETTVRNEEMEFSYVRPEQIYELNLTVDVPAESFLVLAPSPQGRWPTSVGNTFLVTEGEAEQFEQVLLMVPRLARAEAAAE